ncbi:MAG: ATP-binding protein [Chlamydiae bacterium]|nr:ATP-binding protein [Chlamydiota bacterium]
MERELKKVLIKWKNSPLRAPLIVRGARQVGKTYIIQDFGKSEFKDIVTINFETSSTFHRCFDVMDAVAIINEIELILNIRIIPQETLLFLDEIQQCPKALQALRYFKENLPDLHVIAAGSLLEFALHDDDFSFPVGRVQFVRFYPLSFEEYLHACKETSLKEKLYEFDLKSLPPASLHLHLMNRINEYFVVGGMPSVVLAYLNTRSFLEAKYVQKGLWDSFENDFGKYAQKFQHRHLKKIFTEVPRLIGSHVKYSRIDPDLPNPARDMKRAIELLKLAGLLHVISASSAGSVPLLYGLKENIFKMIFLDIGLVEQAMNIDPNFPGLMSGPLAEQFVGQEFLATSDPFLETKLFFWTREQSSAEVDYLIEHKGIIYPIEVKSGTSGKLKSLQIFLNEKKAPFGIKISQEPLNFSKNILSVPFYLIAHLRRLIDSINRQNGSLDNLKKILI